MKKRNIIISKASFFSYHSHSILIAGLLLLASLLAGCATSPATGRTIFTGGLSESQEQRMGMQMHPQILQQFGGEYNRDPELSAYVQAVGNQLAQNSEIPNIDYTFTILDTPIINAMAMPGGYVYVTRGLLALAENEDQLAGVLAHEIGHITALHHRERYGQAVLGTLGQAGLGVALGREAMEAGSPLIAAALRSHSREQEFEADVLGVRYLGRTNMATGEMAGFLENLLAYSRLEAELSGQPGAADRFNIMQTHPRTVDRIEAAARQAGVAAGDRKGLSANYLRRIDGLIYGDSPDQGFARNNRFSHPHLGITFQVPTGYHLSNRPDRVIGRGPGGRLVIFDGISPQNINSPLGYIRAIGQQIPIRNVDRFRLGNQEAASAFLNINGSEAWLIAIRPPAPLRGSAPQLYRFVFLANGGGIRSALDDFQFTLASFRSLSAQEAAQLRPLRIRIREVRPGDTVQSLSQRMRVDQRRQALFRILNGLGTNERLQTGQLVKLIR